MKAPADIFSLKLCIDNCSIEKQ